NTHRYQDIQRHHRTDANKQNKGYNSGKETTDELHQSSTDQVAHALHVGHDTRYQFTRFGVVKEPDRKSEDFLLNLRAKYRNQSLRFNTEDAGKQERGGSLNGYSSCNCSK